MFKSLTLVNLKDIPSTLLAMLSSVQDISKQLSSTMTLLFYLETANGLITQLFRNFVFCLKQWRIWNSKSRGWNKLSPVTFMSKAITQKWIMLEGLLEKTLQVGLERLVLIIMALRDRRCLLIMGVNMRTSNSFNKSTCIKLNHIKITKRR